VADLELDGGVRIRYQVDDWTDPWTQPQSVVLIHGFAECIEAWRAWVPLLGRRYRVLRYDQPGFGESSPVRGVDDLSTEGFVAAAGQTIVADGAGPIEKSSSRAGGDRARRARRFPLAAMTVSRPKRGTPAPPG